MEYRLLGLLLFGLLDAERERRLGGGRLGGLRLGGLRLGGLRLGGLRLRGLRLGGLRLRYGERDRRRGDHLLRPGDMDLLRRIGDWFLNPGPLSGLAGMTRLTLTS